MAITTVNATYLGGGPTKSGQIVQAFGLLGGSEAQMLIGYATFTGDGASTTATLNYIDGTQALNYTPTQIIAAITGGNDTTTLESVKVVDAANSNKTATVTWSAAPANTKTSTVSFIILP